MWIVGKENGNYYNGLYRDYRVHIWGPLFMDLGYGAEISELRKTICVWALRFHVYSPP